MFTFYNVVWWYSQPTHTKKNTSDYQMCSHSTMLSDGIHNQLTLAKPLSDQFTFYNAVWWYSLWTNSHNQNHYQINSHSTMRSDGFHNQLTQPKPLSDQFTFYNAVCWYSQPTDTSKTTIDYQMCSHSTMLSDGIHNQLTLTKQDHYQNWASAWDFQQCVILTCVDSGEPLQPHFKL